MMTQIFLHGLGQVPENWNGIRKASPYICPNLSSLIKNKPSDYQNLYKEVSKICDQSEGALDLCGLSIGSVLALQYASAHPEKVRSLVLIAPQFKMPKTLLKIQNVLFSVMPQSAFMETGFGKKEFIQLCTSMQNIDLSESLCKIECPVLIIYGQKDSPNKKAAVQLSQRLPYAKLKVIEAAGHEVNLDAPEELSKVMDDFYSEISLG